MPSTTILHLDALPPQTTKGTLIRLLEQIGGLDKLKVGQIDLHGRTATVEVPSTWAARLVKTLDGANVGNHFIRASLAADGAEGSAHNDSRLLFDRLVHWLEMEAEAEAEQLLRNARRREGGSAERSGTTLVDLVMRDEYLGLGGRVLVTLAKRDVKQSLPWTRLGIGSPVLLSEVRSNQKGVGSRCAQHPPGRSGNDSRPLLDTWRGVVSDRNPYTIQIALSQSPETDNDRPLFRVDLSSDEVARQRQRAAIERARSASGDRLTQLRGVLFGDEPARFAEVQPLTPLNPRINASQLAAVQFALSAKDVAILHGPPGTGKTTTVVELIRQAVERGEKVLACAPSNIGVDNMFERLLAARVNVVRLGHPARVLPELRDHTLDLLVERHSDVKLARKLVREARMLRDSAARFTRAKPAHGARREKREEAKQLIADARRLEALAVQQILNQADVLCVTLTGIDSEVLGQRMFDLAVIDEACQSTEPACWIPLPRCERLVLAGDHFQLPPTVVSKEAAREGFAISLLERLMGIDGASLSRRLTTQYRMHEQIMAFSSSEFYDGELIADESVREHLLADLLTEKGTGPYCRNGPEGAAHDMDLSPFLTTPLLFVDTAGASFDEEQEPDGESRLNPREAELVARFVTELTEAGLPARDIAVIAPYSAQVRHLRTRLAIPDLEVDTVDGFQGREKEAVIVSLVRSNSEGEIGFLSDARRINVALTRARRKLIVIGDSATISTDPFYQRLLEYFELHSAYRTVWEFPQV